MVGSGGSETVYAGALASGTVLSGGTEVVNSGGDDLHTLILNGGAETLSGGG